VRQGEFNPLADGPSHANTVRSVLRRDPDVVAVAELVTPETAVEIVNADIERSRVYVGLRADNALLAVRQFHKAAGGSDKVAKTLKGVVAGKLARKLCENCRVAYQPAPDLLRKLGLPADRVKQLFKKSGQVIPQNKNQPETCPVCRGTGYLGRVGIYEAYPITPEAQAAIEKQNWDGLRTEFRKHKDRCGAAGCPGRDECRRARTRDDSTRQIGEQSREQEATAQGTHERLT
jgi:type II secretory ATPase GspE/PulE/Tfp pilus assembly ATPase PilB-like protein